MAALLPIYRDKRPQHSWKTPLNFPSSQRGGSIEHLQYSHQNCNIDTNCIVDYTINTELDVNDLDRTEPTKFTRVEIDKLETIEIE